MKTSIPLFAALAATLAWAGPQFPYQGRLDQNGKPVTGSYSLQFTVYDAPTGGNVLWQETFTNVSVVGGAFSVKLGSTVTVDPAALARAQPYVSVAVQGPTDTSFLPLAGRQQLLHTPFASASQQNFVVAGKLGVGGADPDAGTTVTVNGPTSNGANVGILRLNGPSTSLTLDGNNADTNGVLGLQAISKQATAVGGNLTVGNNLGVVGAINGRVAPDYDTGWVAIDTTSTSIDWVITHNLQTSPTHAALWRCGGTVAQANAGCPVDLLMTDGSGYHDKSADVNPVTFRCNYLNCTMSLQGGWWSYNYWSASNGWACHAANGNCFQAAYRVFLWK